MSTHALPMISFPVGAYRFQYRAAAVVRQKQHVLLHRVEGDKFWAIPGGRVEAGESATECLVREFQEELGIDVICREFLWTGENFFEHDGERYQEVGMYFEVELAGDASAALSDTSRVYVGKEGERRLEFAWFATTSLVALDLRPAAVRRCLLEPAQVRHFVQRG
jgi:ADP-ribose pyrophosphatase YjhB (NUDIX family)